MQSNVDWPSIRAEFEQGLSQRTLAPKYGISQSAISQKAKKESWIITPLIIPASDLITDKSDNDLLAIVQLLLKKTAEHAEGNLEPKDIKLLADALSQFHKIKLTLPPEEQDLSQYDLRLLLADATPDELAVVQPVFATIDARRKPLKRTG